MIVHRVSCDYLSLDAMDVSGEQHIGIEHNVYKRRLDLDGKPLEEAQRETKVGETAKITNKTVENPETKTKEVEVSAERLYKNKTNLERSSFFFQGDQVRLLLRRGDR